MSTTDATPQETKAIMLRALLTEDEWVRLRQIAIARNETNGTLFGSILREWLEREETK